MVWDKGRIAALIITLVVVGFGGYPYIKDKLEHHEIEAPPQAKPSPHKDEAVRLFNQGNYEAAVPEFNAVLKEEPYNADMLWLRGISFEKLGKLESAAVNYDSAMEVDPKRSDILVDDLRALEKTQQYDRALYILDKYQEAVDFKMAPEIEKQARKIAMRAYNWNYYLISRSPKKPELWANGGFALFKLDSYKDAITAADKCIAYGGAKIPLAYEVKGDSLYALGQYDKALRAYDKMLELYPEYERGRAHRQRCEEKLTFARLKS